ncbi:hypothetical protein Acr_20g0009940 [Actinidia rufa]|uniref:Retrotransposon gag domain-containing protein n=1 Tax=Actinidia rufa TaxID=165716 RepID=A0A7J0GEE8_9ERIC|nr:hypothetical protein Acr_20g0009940 [Actinidia rufa]
MAATSDITIGVEQSEKERNPAGGKGRRDKSRDIMTTFEARLDKVERAMEDGQEKFEELGQSIAGLEGEGAELLGEMQVTLNLVVDDLRKYIDSKYDLVHAEIAAIREEMKELKGDVSLCKAAVAQGTFSSIVAPKIDVLGQKDDFKREIKKQFYHENSEHEARAKLRRLAHKNTIREYVKEFSELMLEIPDLSDKEALFTFVDGLQSWAKIEVQRRRPQDLASAISVAESLIEFKKSDSSKARGHKFYQGKGGGETSSQAKDAGNKPPTYNKGKPSYDKMGGDKTKLRRFLYDGPHLAQDCPKRSKLLALIQDEDESQSEETSMGSLQFLNTIKVKETPKSKGGKGLMYVDVHLNGIPTKAMLDTSF